MNMHLELKSTSWFGLDKEKEHSWNDHQKCESKVFYMLDYLAGDLKDIICGQFANDMTAFYKGKF